MDDITPPAPPLGSVEGLSSLLNAVHEHAETSIKPKLIAVQEPDTDIKAYAVVSRAGIAPLPASFFDEYRPAPMRREGTAKFTRLESFIDHLKRFGDNDTVVFAKDDRNAPSLLAVLDYHRADESYEMSSGDEGEPTVTQRIHGEYRFGRHRSVFNFPLSDEWKAWKEKDGELMSMAEFALFMEDRVIDVVPLPEEISLDLQKLVMVSGGPDRVADPARLIELGRGLKIHENAVAEEAKTLSSGEGHIRFTADHETRDAGGNTIRVPTLFLIAIPVFAQGEPYLVAARLRYRKAPTGIVFWYELWRTDRVFDHAFNEAVATVETDTRATVMFGHPET